MVRKHATSDRRILLPEEDEETRKAAVEELTRRTRMDRDADRWSVGE